MRITNIDTLYTRCMFLVDAMQKKKAWNGEARSYELNLKKVHDYAIILLTQPLSVNEQIKILAIIKHSRIKA